MAQHDYNLSNNTGALFRADTNALAQAIVTQNSGAGAPTVTFPGMLWLDLSGGGDGVMRRRNQANTAWLTDIGQDQVARNAAAAAQATADSAVQRGGTDAQRTMSAPLILPGTVPTNNQAVSRAQGDLLYQVRLPTTQAGAILVGAAGGWTGVLPPAANDTVLVISGGVPVWQSGAVTAQPNSYVRTRSDGTIDATLIPSVASGLRFRGTFRPAVNAEYPTTGGSGTGGAPAVGDFWVIDGLTTGGYTFLTGTLAGVTVYNGDSIAKSDGANWYRMGSSVELEGYLRADGSVAMTGDLDMAAHSVINVAGVVARAGPPVPLSNFSLDATNVIVSPQRGTTGPDLPALATGQLGTDLGRMQIVVGASGVNTNLLAVPWFSATHTYAIGDYVRYQTGVYVAKQAISAGAFTRSQWFIVMNEGAGDFVVRVQGSSIGTNGAGTGVGNAYLQKGTATQPGYVDLTDQTDTRRGIIGYGFTYAQLNNILVKGEGGWGVVIDGAALNVICNSWFRGINGYSLTIKDTTAGTNIGSVAIVSGNASNPGYVSFHTPDGTRRGFIGYADGGNITLSGDNTWGWSVTGPATTSFHVKIPLRCYATPFVHVGAAAQQIAMTAWGRADAQTRWSWVMEGNDSLTLYAYWPGGTGAPCINFLTQQAGGADSTYIKTHFAPTLDATYYLGLGANRWLAVYSNNGTIQTSDAREKTAVTPPTDAEINVGVSALAALGKYQWLKDLDSGVAQYHFGLTAQALVQMFIDEGLDPDLYALIQHDALPATPPILDTEGNEIEPGKPAGDRYGLSYDELLILCLASVSRRVAKLENNPPTERNPP